MMIALAIFGASLVSVVGEVVLIVIFKTKEKKVK